MVRRDPMAMLPFIGYDAGDYLKHWVTWQTGNQEKLPKIFLVNWFRRNADGGFAWPGFGDNARVLKWAIQRIEGAVDAVEPRSATCRPPRDRSDRVGYEPADVEQAVRVDAAEWAAEAASIEQWYGQFGGSLPAELVAELEGLKARLAPAHLAAPAPGRPLAFRGAGPRARVTVEECASMPSPTCVCA